MPFKPDSIASSARKVQPFLAMQVFERAQELERAGVDVVHLEIGEPDFAVPACVAAATVEAARSGATHYTHSLGVFELRSEIAAYYARRYAVEVEPERVVVTSGTSGAMVLLAALLIDAGDEVLLPNPGYACYDNFVHAFHGLPTFFDVSAEDGFRYDPARIERAITAKTKAVFLNSPSNPTAAVQSRETRPRIANTAARAGGSPVASPHRPSEGTLALHRGEELPLLARGGGSGALLGAALATGDFDCDGRPELLVSAPYHPGPNDPMGQTPGEIYAVEP